MLPDVVSMFSSTSDFLSVSGTFTVPDFAFALTNTLFIFPILTPPDFTFMLEFSVRLHSSIFTPPDCADMSQLSPMLSILIPPELAFAVIFLVFPTVIFPDDTSIFAFSTFPTFTLPELASNVPVITSFASIFPRACFQICFFCISNLYIS